MMRSRFVALFSVALMIMGAGIVSGQDYPNKPVRIVTSGIGGGADFIARIVAQGIAGPLGQEVVVVNFPSGLIPGQTVSRAPADGYTLLITGNSLWLGRLLNDNVPYDGAKDFAPITWTSMAPNILVVHPALPVKSVKELIALAKARPGELNFTISSMGGSGHLATELFMTMAGVKLVRVAYKSGSQEITDLMSGQVQLAFSNAASVAPHLKSGRLKPLAVTSPKPTALFPDLPPVAAALPGYEAVAPIGMFAPAGTSGAIINRLNQETVRALSQPDVKQKLLNSGVEAVASSPEVLAAKIRSDIVKWGKVVKDAGIKAQ